MNRLEQAAKYHKKGYNCSQSVACAFCDRMGMDEETVFKMTEGFGFGVSDSYGTCGAVTGMAVVLGAVNSSANLEMPNSKAATYQKVSALNAKFREKNHSTICRELKGMDSGNMLRSCDGCIEDAVRILSEYFGE